MKLVRWFVFASVASLCLATERPNIVYIISDDQTWTDFGFMGNERVHTPNLDALAAKSAIFPNGYVPTSVCRPSLVTLLTGLYPHQHGVHFNHGPPGNRGYNAMTSREEYERVREGEFELIQNVETLPRILSQEFGYECFQTGKFWEGHWRNAGFTAGMTTFQPPPTGQTFGGVRKLANGERVAHGNGDVGLRIGRETMQPIYDFIESAKAEEKPWFVWYAPYLPHQPHDSPERFYDLARSRPGVQEHELPYFASIAQFDETVGDLVRYAEGANTIFVFAVDNGWSPSKKRQPSRPQEFSHTKNSKRAPFDDGLRTPILIRWDKVVAPREHAGLVSTVDLMPALLSAVGGRREQLPGVDLLPTVKGEHVQDTTRPVFGAIYPGDASVLGHPERDVAYRWVRQGRYKLIVPHGKTPWEGYLKSRAIFDLETDPREQTNLYHDESLAEVSRQLENSLDQWWLPQE